MITKDKAGYFLYRMIEHYRQCGNTAPYWYETVQGTVRHNEPNIVEIQHKTGEITKLRIEVLD